MRKTSPGVVSFFFEIKAGQSNLKTFFFICWRDFRESDRRFVGGKGGGWDGKFWNVDKVEMSLSLNVERSSYGDNFLKCGKEMIINIRKRSSNAVDVTQSANAIMPTNDMGLLFRNDDATK